jgi:hypothetical protein
MGVEAGYLIAGYTLTKFFVEQGLFSMTATRARECQSACQ